MNAAKAASYTYFHLKYTPGRLSYFVLIITLFQGRELLTTLYGNNTDFLRLTREKTERETRKVCGLKPARIGVGSTPIGD